MQRSSLNRLVMIFIAWVDDRGMRPTGRMVMRDMNWFPEYESCLEGKAAPWKWSGTAKDVEDAKVYADKNNYYVFTYPLGTKDAKQRACADALALVEKSLEKTFGKKGS